MTAAFLTIPREIRDKILAEVLSSDVRPAPAGPSSSLNRQKRMRWSERPWSFRATPYHIFCGADERLAEATPALFFVNRQLYAETQPCLTLFGLHQRLDVMFVRECGLWPTWMSLPGVARHVDSVYVQFRIFDPPSDVNPTWKLPAWYRPARVGLPMIVWNFNALLSGYLLHGPTAFAGGLCYDADFTLRDSSWTSSPLQKPRATFLGQ
jgi:hypothetical protein